MLHARYRMGSTIGSGGYSAVYRGWDTQESERAVAIKQITLQGLNTEETIEATNTYNREIEALSTLHHPQDGKYIASGSADKTVQVWSSPSFSS